ncbi:MAG: hypothetical protein ACXW3L_03470, partial [Limisphaerales bacterium]
AFSRPAPSASPTAPAPTRQAYIQQRNIAPAQPVQQQAPAVQTPAPASRPTAIQRSESFSRPSMPVQSRPQPTVVQPQRVAPSAPVQRQAVINSQPSRPAISAPPARVNVSPAPANSGGYRSAPPAAASRPSAAPSRGEGRGRVEIGR